MRDILRQFYNEEIKVTGKVEKTARVQTNAKSNISCIDPISGYCHPVCLMLEEKVNRVKLLSNHTTTLLKNVVVEGRYGRCHIDHLWVPYDLKGYINQEGYITFVGGVYSYKRNNGTYDYGISINGFK